MKVFIKGLKQEFALGDAVKKLVGGTGNCLECEMRRRALNNFLTITGVDPTQMPPQVKPRLPSDYLQMYRPDEDEQP